MELGCASTVERESVSAARVGGFMEGMFWVSRGGGGGLGGGALLLYIVVRIQNVAVDHVPSLASWRR